MESRQDYKYTPLWSETRGSKDDQTPWCFWRRRRRVLVALLAFFGFFNVYALRANLSVAVVAMEQKVTTRLNNGTMLYVPEFVWSPQTKGLILSSFFYGYVLTQLPGSWLAARIGGNRVFAIGVGATSLFTLLTPFLARTSTSLLITARVIEGLCEGVTYPSIHAVWSLWAPRGERTRLATLAFSGSYAGTVVSMPLSSLLAYHYRWPYIFYLFGILGLIWTWLWWSVVETSPEDDQYITATELKYIQNSRGTSEDRMRGTSYAGQTPWRAIFNSPPVWAILAAHFAENWGFYTLLTFLPTFMQDVYKLEVRQAGWASAAPYLAMAATLLAAGHAADWLLARRLLSTTSVRKLFNCGAFFSQALFTLAAAYSTSAVWCVGCLTMAVGLGGFAWAGFSVNHLDIAPAHASTLMALSNTVATLPGIVSPSLVATIVTDKSVDQWRTVLAVSSAVYIAGAAVYGALCSAEPQPWAADPDVPESTHHLV